MHRQPLLGLLQRYGDQHPSEASVVDRVRELVMAHSDCFERSCWPGHITGSAWILSPDYRSVLMTHHRKLNRWLQLGGHADGQTAVRDVALREAQEESGMKHFLSLPGCDPDEPLDIDVHLIPARGLEPEHWHHDIRFLLVAAAGQQVSVSDESHDLRWITRAELADFCGDESVLRMEAKTRQILEVMKRDATT